MLNHIVLMGRLVRDPEMRQTQSGVSVCSFAIACERDFADKATGDRPCDFIEISAWRGTADFVCKYFAKGRMIAVDGRLEQQKYTDKEGKDRTSYKVIANSVYFADSKREGDTENAVRIDFSETLAELPIVEEKEEDLPF